MVLYALFMQLHYTGSLLTRAKKLLFLGSWCLLALGKRWEVQLCLLPCAWGCGECCVQCALGLLLARGVVLFF